MHVLAAYRGENMSVHVCVCVMRACLKRFPLPLHHLQAVSSPLCHLAVDPPLHPERIITLKRSPYRSRASAVALPLE